MAAEKRSLAITEKKENVKYIKTENSYFKL